MHLFKSVFSTLMLIWIIGCGLFGAGIGFLFHHVLAGAIIGALLPIGFVGIFVLIGVMFFNMVITLLGGKGRK